MQLKGRGWMTFFLWTEMLPRQMASFASQPETFIPFPPGKLNTQCIGIYYV